MAFISTERKNGDAMQYVIDMVPTKRVTVIPVSLNDTGARKFTFALVNGGAPYVLTAETVEYLQQGGIVHPCVVSNGVAELDCYADMTATAGAYRCKLRITDTSGVLNTAAFILKVEGGA